MVNTGLAGCRVDETAVFSSTSVAPHTDCTCVEGRDCLRGIHTVDAAVGHVEKTASNASTRPPRRPERPLCSRVGPARSHPILVLNSPLPMELHVETDELARRIADDLCPRVERLLSQLASRIVSELGATPADSPVLGMDGRGEVMGIEPQKLYPVSFVADRWDVSEDNVRKKSQGELPRSDWKGGEIRYRGIDILRYEGVDVEEHVEAPSSPSESGEIDRASAPPQSIDRGSTPAEVNSKGRPYNGNLPALSDEDSSRD